MLAIFPADFVDLDYSFEVDFELFEAQEVSSSQLFCERRLSFEEEDKELHQLVRGVLVPILDFAKELEVDHILVSLSPQELFDELLVPFLFHPLLLSLLSLSLKLGPRLRDHQFTRYQ